jgi:hypothetical protein
MKKLPCWKVNLQFLSVLFLAFLGLSASILIYLIIPIGPGVAVESVKFFETAKNIVNGNGFYAYEVPMTHHPPLYPILIAATNLLQQDDLLKSARLLTAIFFGINIIFFSLCAYVSTEGNKLAAALAAGVYLFCLPDSNILIQLAARSEAPFISFTLSSFLLLYLYIKKQSFGLLLSASLLAGFAIATRYVGVTLLPVLVFALIFFNDRPMVAKARDMFIAVFLALFPLTVWMIRNIIVAETATNRSFAFHPITIEQAETLFILAVVSIFILIVLFVLRQKDGIRNNKLYSTKLPIMFSVFMLTYVLFLGVSISFFDAHTPLDARILFPFVLSFILVAISIIWWLLRALGNKYIWFIFAVLISSLIITNGTRVASLALNIQENGLGYNSSFWKNSETLSFVSEMPDHIKIYTNGPDAVLFLTEKRSAWIPQKINPNTNVLNDKYEGQLKQMIRQCKEGRALVVYFHGITWRWYLPSNEELESKEGLDVLMRFDDGVIFGKSNLKR